MKQEMTNELKIEILVKFLERIDGVSNVRHSKPMHKIKTIRFNCDSVNTLNLLGRSCHHNYFEHGRDVDIVVSTGDSSTIPKYVIQTLVPYDEGVLQLCDYFDHIIKNINHPNRMRAMNVHPKEFVKVLKGLEAEYNVELANKKFKCFEKNILEQFLRSVRLGINDFIMSRAKH